MSPSADPYRIVIGQVARLLREERERQKLSMSRVAEMAGLSQQMVSYVERGMRTPTLETLLRISGALRVDVADIIHAASLAAKESCKR